MKKKILVSMGNKPAIKIIIIALIVAIFISNNNYTLQYKYDIITSQNSVKNEKFDMFSSLLKIKNNVDDKLGTENISYNPKFECRMYAAISNNLPDNILNNQLIDEPNSLKNLAAIVNIDGWGIGYYPYYGGPVIIERGAERAYTDTDYDNTVDLIDGSEPKITFAHVRNCQNGCCCHGCETIDDPHPFVRIKNNKTWTFMHNGAIDVPAGKNLLGDYLNDNPLNCSGVCIDDQNCDSEVYFLLLLKHIENCSWHVTDGIVEALNLLIDANEDGGLNFVLSDGESLWAFRRHQLSHHTLYYLYNESDGYSAVASEYPSSNQGDWVAMDDYELIILSGNSSPVIINNISDYNNYDVSLGLGEEWNLVSLPVNESVHKDDITVNYQGVNYTWQQAVYNGITLGFIYGWNVIGQSYVTNDVFDPSQCYWMYAFENCDLWIACNTFNDDEYITSLKHGWGMMGLPYNVSLAKEDLVIHYNGADFTWQQAVDNGIILGFIYGWDTSNQNYVSTDVLNPGKGYWMYTYYNCTLTRSEM